MERITHHRPRVARETRLLVMTALLAVLALWMLARLRFPTPPAAPRAISGILSSLGTGADFDGLATQVARVRAVVGQHLLVVEVEWPASGELAMTTSWSALRIGGDLAVVQVPEGARLRASPAVVQVAYDSASQLAVIRVSLDPETSNSAPRVTRPPQPPQYVIASAVYPDGVALRPVFVAAMAAVDAPLWSSMAWAVPSETGLTPGSFLFTRDGELAGMTVTHKGSLAFVSGETLLNEADRLIAREGARPGDYGIQVEPLTPPLQRALGTTSGVAITWVDPNGAAGNDLVVGDVIDTVDGQKVASVDHWRRHVAALVADSQVRIGVFRTGAVRTVTLRPKAAPAPETQGGDGQRRTVFGARTRMVRGVGAEVLSVSSESMASRAGLAPGDFITFISTSSMPTPAQIVDLTSSLQEGRTLLLGVRRGDTRLLLVLER